jgi:hypothetical protein
MNTNRNRILRTITLALLFFTLTIVLSTTAVAQIQVPVSGYEIFLGRDCVIAGAPATCGTTFTGWTGLTSDGGWIGFPGTAQGVWSIQINYIGNANFGTFVTIASGKWNFFFINGAELRGKVLGGSVVWPADENTASACGVGVAVVQANLSVAGGPPASITGCLHDLPAGSVIPPKVWGTFNF